MAGSNSGNILLMVASVQSNFQERLDKKTLSCRLQGRNIDSVS